MDAVKTGRFIAELRHERGLTQQQLAERLHVSFKAVSRWETGRGTPDLDNLEALSRELEVSVVELLNGERIEEPVTLTDAEILSRDVVSVMRGHLKQSITRSAVFGLIAGMISIALVAVWLTSSNAIPFYEGLVEVENSESGILLASFDESVTGFEIDYETESNTGEVIAYISCYSKIWDTITGTTDLGWHAPDVRPTLAIGSKDTVASVYYYPGYVQEKTAPFDSRTGWYVNALLYARDGSDAFLSIVQPRRVYDRLIVGSAAVGGVMLVLFLLLRKRRLAYLLLMGTLLPLCLALSIVIVLWGKLDQVFNASFYFSEIALLTLVLFFCTYVIAARVIYGKEAEGLPAGLLARQLGILVCTASALVAVACAACIAYARWGEGFRSRTVLVPTPEYVLEQGYPLNASGQTYGPGGLSDSNGEMIKEPDLVLAQGEDGAIGYLSLYDTDYYYVPSSPEEAVTYTESKPSEEYVPLYDRDGKTVIGTFRIGG